MPDLKVHFLKPEDVLGALTAQPRIVQVGLHLGPSAPHEFDDAIDAAAVPIAVPFRPAETPLVRASLSAHPGSPPSLGSPHYTQVLDELWPEFDEPEERTAARLGSLLKEVADEAQRVHLLGQDVWETLPAHKVPDSERDRYNREFLSYLQRLNGYRNRLAQLEPESTATDSVHIGLVQRQQGAGPVPDAIMHLYFAQQLGILADHSKQMSEGFVGRVMDGLAAAGELIGDAADAVKDAEQSASDRLNEAVARITRTWKIAGGLLLGTVAVLGGALIAVQVTTREPRR